ncbi:hypothetical protein [Exiguobacterium qingdaonense]|uniref:hypothetical protein n=1 Tax=Exiguobacterium qingdaonense TaxID=2751251 RepID=UPI001BE918F1|nr:hypothetical protein [Exiguobacterium qingdaonense]
MILLENGVYVVNSPLKDNYIKEAQMISEYTVNTWQKNRSLIEKKLNTQNGKRAEHALECVLEHNGVAYIPYDNFRTDMFKKHAPFDGLIYSKSQDIHLFLNKINSEIENGDYGKISIQTLNELVESKVFPVEIKSTQVAKRHLPNYAIENYMDRDFLCKISKEIQRKDDFLTYPFFCRYSNDKVDLNWYFDKARNIETNFKTLEELLQFEKQNQAFFHIRVYQKNNIFFVLKFIDRNEFFEKSGLKVKKMYQPNKSENAVYFSKKMTKGYTIDNIKNYFNEV